MSNLLGFDVSLLESTYEGKLDPSKTTWYEKKVDEAVRLLLSKCPGIPKRIAAGTLDKDFVGDKVAAAVLRVVRNPQGLANESEGNYSYGLSNRVASGDLWYPDSDLADLGCGPTTEMPRTVRVKVARRWGP